MSAPWQAPELTSENRLPMHSVPHGDRVDLDGRWRFQLLHSPDETPGADWSEVDVPGCWTMQDTWDKPHYTNVQMPWPLVPVELPAVNPTGIYEREFELDRAWLDGRRIVLHVGAAESVLFVTINGQHVGMSKDSHLAAEFDVTDFVRPGANSIHCKVVKWSDASYIEDQDQWWHGGITRSVYLFATPRVHLADVRINAGLADDLTTGTLEILADVDWDGAPQEGWSVEVTLGDEALPVAPVPIVVRGAKKHVTRADSEPLSRHLFDLVARNASEGLKGEDRAEWESILPRIWPPVENRGVVRTEISGVRRWSAEQPNLYPLQVVLRSPDGEAVETADFRVGFRRVEIDGLHLLINGKAVLLRGVNRHDFDQFTGRVISPESIRADLVQMKQFGFNAVRTSHYPNEPAFLELTDELGLYVVAEADIESHAFIDTLCHDPRYLNQWVTRGERLVRRDKNHASVIIWSLGNESGHGPNQDAEAGYIREYDPSRPIQYEGAIRWDWSSPQKVSDITCPMYPPISAIVAHAKSGRQIHPLIMCEYSHAMGNSNGTLAEYWDAVESTDGLQGGFIWEWWDHGLVQKLPDGTTRWAYGGDFGDEPNDGNFCLDGLNWPDRTPKPAMFEHRQIAAPVVVAATGELAAGGVVAVTNRQYFTGLAWLHATWEVTADGEVVASGVLPLPDLGPEETAQVTIPSWPGATSFGDGREWFLNVHFTLAAEQGWAPAGYELCWSQLELSAQPPAGLRHSGPIVASEAVIAVDDAGLPVHPLLSAAPRLSLWRAPTDNDRIMGLGRDWREWGIADLARTVRSIDRDGDATVVVADNTTSSGIVVRHERRITPLAGGGFRADETVVVPDTLPDLARVGMVLEAVPELRDATWFGRGPVETYPDRRRAGAVGRWHASVTDLTVPYVRPQENGGRADVRWLELSDGSGRGFRLTFDRPLQVSATHFRDADLTAAKHIGELTPRPETIVHFDLRHRGIGTASCGPDTTSQYKFGPGTYSWSWTLEPLA